MPNKEANGDGAPCGDAEGTIATEAQLVDTMPQLGERVFYWGSGSPQAWRVLLAMEEKGVAYRSVCVSFASGVMKTPFFRALNPRMRIPVLVEPVPEDRRQGLQAPALEQRVVVYESSAILEYVERVFPTPRTMPEEPGAFAVAQMRLNESNESLSVLGELVAYLRRVRPGGRNARIVDAKCKATEAELQLWETYLDGNSFLVPGAETPMNCDFSLFCNIAYAVRCGLQLDGLYPRLANFYARMRARPSVEKTWPPHWRTTKGANVLTKCKQCCSICCQCQTRGTKVVATTFDAEISEQPPSKMRCPENKAS